MNLQSTSFLAPITILLAACASSSGPDPAPTPSPDAAEPPVAEAPATQEGDATVAAAEATFTEVQADRGRDLFRAQCTECHYSSEFSDSQFQFKWSRRSAGNLYQLIQSSMPETAPGSLTPEETVDLVSYILQMNGFDPGASELAADRAILDAISLASIRGE